VLVILTGDPAGLGSTRSDTTEQVVSTTPGVGSSRVYFVRSLAYNADAPRCGYYSRVI
jgi:hypothetical protein